MIKHIVLCASIALAPTTSYPLSLKTETPIASHIKTQNSRPSLEEVMYDCHQDMKSKVEGMIKQAFYQGGFFDHKGYCESVKTEEGCTLPILADISNSAPSFPAFEFDEHRTSDKWDMFAYTQQIKIEIEHAILTDLPKRLPTFIDGYLIQPTNGEIVSKVSFEDDSVSVKIVTDLFVWDAVAGQRYLLTDKEIKIGLPAGKILKELDSRMKRLSDDQQVSDILMGSPGKYIIREGSLLFQYLIKGK